jgi:hypothetical protein
MPINNYIDSLQGGPPGEHNAFKTFLLIIGAVFSGYTASQFPPQFLIFFSTPLGQFITFMILGLGLYQTKNIEFVVYDSILFVILLQMLLYISNEIYEEQNKGKNKGENNDNEDKDTDKKKHKNNNNNNNNNININKSNNNLLNNSNNREIISEELF